MINDSEYGFTKLRATGFTLHSLSEAKNPLSSSSDGFSIEVYAFGLVGIGVLCLGIGEPTLKLSTLLSKSAFSFLADVKLMFSIFE